MKDPRFAEESTLIDRLVESLPKPEAKMPSDQESLSIIKDKIPLLLKYLDHLTQEAGVDHYYLGGIQEIVSEIRYLVDPSYREEVSTWNEKLKAEPIKEPISKFRNVTDAAVIIGKPYYTDNIDTDAPPLISPKFEDKYKTDPKFKELVDKNGYMKDEHNNTK